MSKQPKGIKQSQSGLKVVLYLRISKDRDDQTSIETQLRECLAYCKARGWEVVGEFQDLGKSGYKPGVKRQGFDAAINMVTTKQADLFLVWKLSRFIRRIREFHMFLDVLVKAGGQFDSVTDPVDYSTASGELLLAMTAGFAQMDSAAKSDFAQGWNDGRTAKGAVPQGPRPFGYDRVSKQHAVRDQTNGTLVTLVPNTREQAAIVFAAESLLSGEGTLKGIIRELEDFPGTKGTKLTIRGLRSALVNPTTAALRVSHDEEGNQRYIEGCWEPLLTRATWEAVVSLLEDPERSLGGSNEVKHLVSGLLLCGKCGGYLNVRKWKQIASKKNGNVNREAHRYTCFECFNSAATTVINEAIKERLLTTCDQKTWEGLREQGRGYDPEVIREIEEEEQAAFSMWKAGRIKLARYQAINEEIEQRMAQATGATALDLPEVSNLAESWDAMSVLDQRRVLRVVFKEMRLDPANGSRNTLGRLFLTRSF